VDFSYAFFQALKMPFFSICFNYIYLLLIQEDVSPNIKC
jgi:hypothetical protein